jgi:hypothetical protein
MVNGKNNLGKTKTGYNIEVKMAYERAANGKGRQRRRRASLLNVSNLISD